VVGVSQKMFFAAPKLNVRSWPTSAVQHPKIFGWVLLLSLFFPPRYSLMLDQDRHP
jgi:hypothetical protein